MKTIGELLKATRLKKKYSLKKVERETKIKREFVEAIEENNWQVLPEFPVVLGFVKNLSAYLNLDVNMGTALLKRDYPPKVLSVNPKPDVGGKFTWTPKYTFFVGILIVLLAIFGYLGLQFVKFNSPPNLEVLRPEENQEVITNKITVSGSTDPDAVLRVNNQLFFVNSDGSFSGEVEIFEGTKEISINAKSRSGKERTIVRHIVPKLQ